MVDQDSFYPGPWMIIPPGGPNGRFYGLLSETKGWIVATQIEGRGNARLCAAAPLLLDACQRALETAAVSNDFVAHAQLIMVIDLAKYGV